jgi:hypothetical protein
VISSSSASRIGGAAERLSPVSVDDARFEMSGVAAHHHQPRHARHAVDTIAFAQLPVERITTLQTGQITSFGASESSGPVSLR